MEHNKIDEKRQKELELQRAAIESERAARLVEERQCTPPKKSRILERHKLRNNGDTLLRPYVLFLEASLSLINL